MTTYPPLQHSREIYDSGTGGQEIKFGDSPSLGPFGRLRVAGKGNRFDVEFIYNKQPDIIDDITGVSGTSTFNANERDVSLAVNFAISGSSQALYGYDVPYTAGDGQLIELTGTLDDASIGGGTAFVFLRSNISGTVQYLDLIDQANWSENSVGDVAWDKSQIFQMDFQSLKVGRIRFGLVRDGLPVPVHEITNDNIRATGYWQLPTLPPYWRIWNDNLYTYSEIGYGDTNNGIGFMYRTPINASAMLRAICGTVKSEGGLPLFEIPGFNRSIDNGVTAITASTTLVPILSIRPKSTFNGVENRGLYIPTGFGIQSTQNIKYVLLYRPTLTDPSWADVDADDSGVEYDVAATAVTGGVSIESDYLSAAAGNNNASKEEGVLGRTLLKVGRTGTNDILTLAAIRTGGSDASVLSSLKWKEIR